MPNVEELKPAACHGRSLWTASVLKRDTARNRPSSGRASQHWRFKDRASGTPLYGASGRLISTANSHQFSNHLTMIDGRDGATGEADIGVDSDASRSHVRQNVGDRITCSDQSNIPCKDHSQRQCPHSFAHLLAKVATHPVATFARTWATGSHVRTSQTSPARITRNDIVLTDSPTFWRR